MENILFRYTINGIEIILADIGSAHILPDFPITTYPPYEFIMNENDTDFAKVGLLAVHPYKQNKLLEKNSLISWGVGILTLQLLSVDIKDLNNRIPAILRLLRTNPDVYIKEKVHSKIINELNTPNNTFIITLIQNTLCSYNNRWDLTKIITILNILRLNQYRERQKNIKPIDRAVGIFNSKLTRIREEELNRQNFEQAKKAARLLKKTLSKRKEIIKK